ncbi:MFS transporter [Tamaricihabitans halophyticus]|uniref:MFS transporter n=1 Tax=Tamaricihabitans halophyticus TaxID=1262583 RepID=UPI003C722C0E
MSLQSYRAALRIRGVPSSLLLMFVVRLPMTAAGLTMTLHVVSELGMGYGAAGLVGAVTTGGTALGAPLLGRFFDRYGLRPVIAVCAIASTVYWLTASHLPYVALLCTALPAGLLAIPAGPVGKQILAALVPERQRRSVFSLDTVSVELSFMIGPALGIGIATAFSGTVALSAIGICFGVGGLLLWLMNPPIRNSDEIGAGELYRPRLRQWVNRSLIATWLTAFGALFVLIGTELSALAVLRASGNVELTGVVIAVICLASLIGGLVYGAASRTPSQRTLMFLLAALLIPVAVLDEPWWLLAIALIPSNLVCAPTLAATSEAVSRLAPPQVRGTAMGLQDSSVRLGLAVGNPAIGLVIDHGSASWGFAASGLVGVVIAGVAMLLVGFSTTSKPAAPRESKQRTRAPR